MEAIHDGNAQLKVNVSKRYNKKGTGLILLLFFVRLIFVSSLICCNQTRVNISPQGGGEIPELSSTVAFYTSHTVTLHIKFDTLG